MKPGRSQRSSIHRSLATLLLSVLLSSAALLLVTCNRDPDCQRCEYFFTWDSDGNLTDVSENCAEINCNEALCGSCYDIEYNRSGRPESGTCDSCKTDETQCDAGQMWCRAEGSPRGGCVDIYTHESHCGECNIVCEPGQECREGQCI